MSTKLRAVLFDLDGVLIDSESRYTEFWSEIDRLYPTGIENFALVIKGTNLVKILATFPTEAIRDDITERLDAFERQMDLPFYPGAERLLEELHRSGVMTAIVTSSMDSKMEMLFSRHRALRGMIDALVTGSMVSRSKPHPEGYLAAAKMLGAEPGECIVVEDSLQGLEAGRRAGAHVVAIATTNTRDRLEGLAQMIVDSVDQLSAEALISML